MLALGADRRHGGRSDNGEVGRFRTSVAHRDGVAQMQVERGHRGRPEDHLVRRIEAVPGEERGLHLGTGAAPENRHPLAVEFQGAEVHPTESRHVGVVVEQSGRLVLRRSSSPENPESSMSFQFQP